MYINDISIFAYIIVAIIGVVTGQISDYLNCLLPKHKKLLSKKSFKEYLADAQPKYLLMIVHIVINFVILNRYGLNDISTYKFMALTPLIISAFVIDYKLQIIPNRLTLLILELGLIFTFISGVSDLNIAINMFEGLIVGCALFLAITIIGGLVFGKETMGFGDVKMMAALGLFVGYQGIIAVAILAFLIAALYSIILIIVQKVRHRELIEYIAFGPFIVIAMLIVMFVPIDVLVKLPFVIFTFGKYGI